MVELRGPGFFIIGSIGIAISYGIAHDLVTASLAVDYFTIYHPKILESRSPIVMAFVWGFLATWWVGLAASVLLVVANRLGRAPSLPWRRILRAFGLGAVALWLTAMSVLGGIYLYAGKIPLSQRRPTFEYDRTLVAVAVTHAYSYVASAVFAVTLAVWVLWARIRASRQA